jgi:hypothetical protein
MGFIKNLFRKKWDTCTRCKKTIYFGDLYGSIHMPPDSLSIIKRPIEYVYCESCTAYGNGFDTLDGSSKSITERGRVTK